MPRVWLPILLVVSWGLRIALVLRGGQAFFQDEMRYFRSVHLLDQLLWYGDAGWALDELLSSPEHIGFAWLGVVPELFRTAGLRLRGLPNTAALTDALLWIPAIVLSLASVGCIGLAYPIARAAGAGRGEALLAAALLACSTSLLYWSRHLMPYDTALCLALLGLWLGLEPRTTLWRSALVGALAGLALLTYNGYWIVTLIVLGLHAVAGQRTLAGMLRRGLATLPGLVLFPALLSLLAVSRGLRPLNESLSAFAGTVTMGEYAEGWSFPWEYLWHAEHGLLLVWAAGAALALAALLRERRARLPVSRGLLWLGGVAGVYLLLALGSTGLHQFVVYGRLARQVVPFLCLLAAYGVGVLAGQRAIPAHAWRFAAAVVVAQVALNFGGPFGQRFPGDLEQRVAATYGPVRREVTVAGCCWTWTIDEIHRAPGSTAYGASRYVLLNTTYLYPARGAKDPPAGEVVLQVPHPFEYLPYQYESFGPIERAIFRRSDISMRLIDTGAPTKGSP